MAHIGPVCAWDSLLKVSHHLSTVSPVSSFFSFMRTRGKQAPRSSSSNVGRGGGSGISLRADPHMMLLKTLSNEGAAALAMRVVEDLRSREKGDLPPVTYEHLTTAFTVQGDLDQAERTLRMRPLSWWGVTRHRYAVFFVLFFVCLPR